MSDFCMLTPGNSTGASLAAALHRMTTARATYQALGPARMSWGTHICILIQSSSCLALTSSPFRPGWGLYLSHSREMTVHLHRPFQLTHNQAAPDLHRLSCLATAWGHAHALWRVWEVWWCDCPALLALRGSSTAEQMQQDDRPSAGERQKGCMKKR